MINSKLRYHLVSCLLTLESLSKHMQKSSNITITLLIMILAQLSFAQSILEPAKAKSIKVYVFMSETCPVCQRYTLTLKNLYEKYRSQGVVFIAVYPEEDVNADSVNSFQKKYNIADFRTILDPNASLAKELGATITPEAVVKATNGKIVYRGRIDDTFYALGKSRNVITSNDLDDAIAATLSGQTVKQPKTKAVGCIITIPK